MKRSMIRICGAAMAGLAGILAKNQAFAFCGIDAKRNANYVQAWLSTSCNENAIQKVCGDNGHSETWNAGIYSYSGYCWCRNVSSDNKKGEIACKHGTGEDNAIVVALNEADGCNFNIEHIVDIQLGSPTYSATCGANTDACYYDNSAACARWYATTGEVVDQLSGCCKPCYTGSSLTGLIVGDDTYYGSWTVSGAGGTGIDTCVYSASSVTDKYGTFVAGKGTLYKCSPGSGTGTGM